MSFLKNRKNVLFLFVVIALIIIVLFVYFNFKNTSYVYGDCVKYRSTEDLLSSSSSDHLIKFSSCNDLTAKLKEAYNEIEFYNYYGYSTNKPTLIDIAISGISSGKVSSVGSVAASSDAGNFYSTTNVQVHGVDEPDLVKTDGTYIYVLSKDLIEYSLKFSILRATPEQEAKLISSQNIVFDEIDNGSRPFDYSLLFVHENRALIIQSFVPKNTLVFIYDISNKEKPVMLNKILFDSSYVNSRLINGSVYLILMKYIYHEDIHDIDRVIPKYKVDKMKRNITDCSDIYYMPPLGGTSNSIITILKINLKDAENKSFENVALIGDTDTIYASHDNIYVVANDYNYIYSRTEPKQMSKVHKFAISNSSIKYLGSFSVPGRILNQNSLDEFKGDFRIATTTIASGNSSDGESIVRTIKKNNIYVYDQNMSLKGMLEGLTIERIDSFRFIGPKAYVVTFEREGPVFVVDLSDPSNPKVLGKLKISGYSNYLHPINDTLLLAIGKSTVEEKNRNFVIEKGLKISLFDVTDVTKPKELSYIEIGDRKTESYALDDHKALVFDSRYNLLVIPVTLAIKKVEEDELALGKYVFDGAYVLNISVKDGISVKGTITHLTEEDIARLKSRYTYYISDIPNDKRVRRALYINDNLYTISYRFVKINKLLTLDEIKQIEILDKR